jgi:hypothetical protein
MHSLIRFVASDATPVQQNACRKLTDAVQDFST